MRRGVGIGRHVILTTMRAPDGQPIVDGAHTISTNDDTGERKSWGGLAFRTPWGRDALVVGVLGARVPSPMSWRHRWRRWRYRHWPRPTPDAAVSMTDFEERP